MKKLLYPFATVIIASVLIAVFYGNILQKPGEYLYSSGGDGLKSYYCSYYHIKYDTSYLGTQCMNYPYGEFAFYTDSQPLITNTLKFLKGYGLNMENSTISIINLMMLFSLVISAFIVYLLLQRIKLPPLYSVVVANIIVFLSPQLDRMGGHFSLSYVFFIPLYLYLLHLLFSNGKYYISIIIGIVSFISLITHAYFFAFLGFLSFFMILLFWIFDKNKFPLYKSLIHILLQIIIPFVLFSLLSYAYPTDRTAYPWGFFASMAYPESVFLPIGKPYGKFLQFSYLKWEGMAYVGLVSTIVYILIIIQYVKNIKSKKYFVLIEDKFLNIALWTSLFALIFSFAYPFQWNLQWLMNYLGPLKQFRAVGRFSWLFYYIINIIAFYLVWNWYKSKKNLLSKIVLVVVLLWGSYDAYLNVRNREVRLTNKIPELFDTENKLPQNQWVNQIKSSDFQAILPFPYFHVGSEVYWISNGSNSVKTAFTISWKTGIPINAVLMSRTSISQTMKGLEYYFEPLSRYSIVDDYHNNKDILLIVCKNEKLNDNENRFIKYSIPIEDNDSYTAYRLPIDSVVQLNMDYRSGIIGEVNNLSINSFIPDSSNSFIFQSFGNTVPDNIRNKSVKSFPAKQNNIVFDTTLFNNIEPIVISFWMKDMDKDLIPRSSLKIRIKRNNGDYVTSINKTIFKIVKYVDSSGWGLIEAIYQPIEENEKIRIKIRNGLVTGGEVVIDDLLIRQNNINVYYETDDFVYKNNRYILR